MEDIEEKKLYMNRTFSDVICEETLVTAFWISLAFALSNQELKFTLKINIVTKGATNISHGLNLFMRHNNIIHSMHTVLL